MLTYHSKRRAQNGSEWRLRQADSEEPSLYDIKGQLHWECGKEWIHINIKVSGKIEKTVEINPIDVIVSLKEKWGFCGYFVKDGKVYEFKQCSLFGDYKDVLAPDCIQDKAKLISAIGVLFDELS